MQGIVAGAILVLAFSTPFHFKSDVKLPEKKVLAVRISPTPTPKKPDNFIYIVKNGDTLDTIAKSIYKSEAFWTNIWNSNKQLEDPRNIHSGMELTIKYSISSKADELDTNLEQKYEELISPSISPTPTNTPSTPTPVMLPQGLPTSFDDIYKQAGSKFGIPWQILYGIHLTETGQRDGAITSGYGSGAQGPMQFLPSTFNLYATDGNGDGVIDINNASDAIYTAANFIAAHGGIDSALKSYGGDTAAILNAARSRGYSQ